MAGRKSESDGETLTEKAVELLQRDILAGLHQPGTRMAVLDLSERYGIGTTPIREALARLTAQNLVSAIGRRGFHVRELSYEDLRDITRLRFVIEREGLLLSMEKGGDDWETVVVAALYRLRLYVEREGSSFGAGGEEFDRLHRNFHAALIGGCGSPRIIGLAADLYKQAYRYRHSMMRKLVDPEDFVAIHDVLAQATLKRERDKACELLRVHLNSTLSTVYPDRDQA